MVQPAASRRAWDSGRTASGLRHVGGAWGRHSSVGGAAEALNATTRKERGRAVKTWDRVRGAILG